MSQGEDELEFQLKAYKIHFEREWKFCERKFRFDFAFPHHKLAVEIEGGIYSGGRHTRGTGYIKDMEKYNLAAMNGWTLLRYTPQQIKTGEPLQEILKFITIKLPSKFAHGILPPDYRVKKTSNRANTLTGERI